MVSFGSSSNLSVEDLDENEAKKCKIYLSYHWKCLQKVKILHDELIRHECLDVFIDMIRIKPGMNFLANIVANIQKADIIIVCVSREYVKSKNCEKELVYADVFGKPMLSLYMEKIPIPELGSLGYLIAREKYCNLFKKEGLFDSLRESIQYKEIIDSIDHIIKSKKIETFSPITSVIRKQNYHDQSPISQSVISFRNDKPLEDILKAEAKSNLINNTRRTEPQRVITKTYTRTSVRKAKEIDEDKLILDDEIPPKKRTEYILEMHPILKELNLLLKPKIYLDPTGDRLIFKPRKNLMRGNEKYFPPAGGWIRYGLDVKSLHLNSLEWLSKDGNQEEWSVGYHGLKSGQLKLAMLKYLFDKNMNFYPKCAESKNTKYSNEKDVNNKSIFFGKPCGKGVFCSFKPELAEENTSVFILNDVKYKLLLQCRIDPTKIRIPQNESNLWIINSPDDIRPYGLLIKEILE